MNVWAQYIRACCFSGKFTDPQIELYEALLEVQEQCFLICGQTDVSMEDIFLEMLALLGTQLKRLKVINSDVSGINIQKVSKIN